MRDGINKFLAEPMENVKPVGNCCSCCCTALEGQNYINAPMFGGRGYISVTDPEKCIKELPQLRQLLFYNQRPL